MKKRNTADNTQPECFGKLSAVFPKGEDGFRHTPGTCMDACPFKTDCLRLALEAEEGLVIQEEVVDRAYHAGLLTFMQRWSRKKRLRTKATARND